MESSSQDSSGRRADSLAEATVHTIIAPRDATTRRVMREVRARLAATGALAALEWLNARTRFRFTGVYHADPPVLRNLFLVDRENPSLNVSGEVTPLDETYCAITSGQDTTFTTTDAARDERLVGHRARRSVISYAGVPLRGPAGGAWGTLCHFDLRPRLLSPAELGHLEAVAPLFAEWLAARGAD